MLASLRISNLAIVEDLALVRDSMLEAGDTLTGDGAILRLIRTAVTFGAGLDIDEWKVTEAGADPIREEGDTVVAIIRGEQLLRPDEPGCLPTEVGDRVVYVARRAPGTNGTNGQAGEGAA